MRAPSACLVACLILSPGVTRPAAAQPAATTAPGNPPPGTSPAGDQPAAAATGVAIPGTGLTLTTTGTVASDYLFRGISQTRNRPAVQGTFDLAHESGFYVDAFVTNAAFLGGPYNDTRQEVDVLAGYRFTLGRVSLDLVTPSRTF